MNGTTSSLQGNVCRKIPLHEAVGTVLAHDITEVLPGEYKGRAFRKGHVICEGDLCHLRRLGKNHLFVLSVPRDAMHEDDAAVLLAKSLAGEGVRVAGPPSEGKAVLVAKTPGLLKIKFDALREFNLSGDMACATLHNNSVVACGQVVADTRAIPLIVSRGAVMAAAGICRREMGIIRVLPLRVPNAGLVITGNEVYSGLVQDAFEGVIREKIERYGGTLAGISFAPDDAILIEDRLKEMIGIGADLLIVTGGMSVDPDDVTRLAIRHLGTGEIAYGSAASPGAMILVAWLDQPGKPRLPVIGVPACALHAKTTVFDLILPRILSGEEIGKQELAEFGHGGLCMRCAECRFPICPFGK